LADRLLNVGRPSDSAADGEEEGDGATTSGVVEGEAGAGGVAVGVVCGVAEEVVSGVGVGVVCGVAVVVASACGVGVGVGVVGGEGVVAGVAAGGAVGAGDGELAGCPPDGAAGCCSHPTTRTLAKATATTRRLFMPNNTDARTRRIFKTRYKGLKFRHFA
jgi:hypothetical protein